MKKGKTIVGMMIVAALLTGCTQARYPNDPAGSQGPVSVSSRDFYEYFSAITMSYEYGLNQKFKDFQHELEGEAEDAMTWREVMAETALSYALTEGYIIHLCEERGLTLTDDDEATLQSQIDYYVTSSGGRAEYELIILQNGMTVSFFENSMRNNLRVERLLSDMHGEAGMTDEDLFQAMTEQFIRVKHILIKTIDDYNMSLTDEEIAEKTALKDRLVAELESGADFDELMATYGEDPGMDYAPEGYVIDPYVSFDYDFMAVAFSLEEDEIDVAEGFYGFHIIKRFPLRLQDLGADNLSSYAAGSTVGDMLLNEFANVRLGDLIEEFRQEHEIERNDTVVDQMIERYIRQDRFIPEVRDDEFDLSGFDNLDDLLGDPENEDE